MKSTWWLVMAMVVVGCSGARSSTTPTGATVSQCGNRSAKACGEWGKQLLKQRRPEALGVLEAACRKGDVVACDDSGVDFKATPALAFELTEHGCRTLRSSLACRNLGVAYQYGTGVAVDLEKARALYHQECERSSAKACRFEANLLFEKQYGMQDLPTAATLFGRACKGRDAYGCSQLVELADELKMALMPQERQQLLQLACADGNGWGCVLLGRHQRSLQNPEATRSFHQGCEWREVTACNEGSQQAWREGNSNAAVNMARNACSIDPKAGCWRLGLHAALQKEDATAVQVWEAACDRGDGQSCRSLGLMSLHGKGTPIDGVKAEQSFRKACDLGSPSGCETLGWQYLTGTLVTKDLTKARAALETACEKGACAELGVAVGLGHLGAPANRAKALVILEKGCVEQKSAGACRIAGFYLYEGKGGVAKDLGRSASLYSRGCELGDQIACNGLAYNLIKGDGVLADRDRAFALWEKACVTVPEACDSIGEAHEKGLGGTPKNPKLAFERYSQACTRGVKESCVNAARVAKPLKVTPPPVAKAEAPARPAATGAPAQQLALPDFGKLLSGF